MNTLKPLLTVAVLAGIGYGVYIRLNAGANAPPPPVDAGWDASPAVQLPGQATGAPWSPPGAVASAAPSSPSPIPGASAPPFHGAPGAAGAAEAPPFGAPGAHQAPPAGGPGDMAPPHHPAGGNPFAGNTQAPPAGAPPYDQAPPHGGPPVDGVPGAPVAPLPGDPYGAPADPAGAMHSADPYGAPPADPGPPGSAPPADYPAGDYPVPPAGAAPVDSAAPLNGEFAAMMQSAQRELENGQLAAALRQLTGWYGNPQLSPHEQQQLNTMLDQVAGTVVYSTQNLTENPYEVQPGERLEAIGEKYQVPWQLLAKINGIEDPAALQPGERLKVVRGPFEAIVSLERRELVLRTGDGLYAGRFPIGVGAEHPPQEGTFAVSDKVPNPVYYGRENAIGAEDPNNPLGERWIGLGKQMAIHGTNNPGNIGRNDLPGWISLREEDVAEVYDILGLGSRVTIRR